MSGYICHYGVKGMKWGVRHDPERVGRVAKKQDRFKEKARAKQNFINAKKNRGFSDKQKIYAKRGAIAAGVALMAVGGIALAKSGYFRYNTAKLLADTVITPKNKMQTMVYGTAKDSFLSKEFYTTDNALDKLKYSGPFTLGNLVNGYMSGRGAEPTRIMLQAKKNLKVAGKDTGVQTFKKLCQNGLIKDEDTARKLAMSFGKDSKGRLDFSVMRDKDWESAYKTFNRLPKYTGIDPKYQQEFFEALRKDGYSAVIDLNNVNKSFGSRRAMIVFDTENVVVNSMKEQHLGSTVGRTAVNSMLESKYTLGGYSACAALGLGSAYADTVEDERRLKKQNKW